MSLVSRREFLSSLGMTGGALLVRPCAAAFSDSRSDLQARLAADPLRPQFHLLPAANWMNDPNGPIYFHGTYHMFFQYNPNGAFWGTMHWAHATSPDMIHWKHEAIAMAPTPGGYDQDGVFSGSAVVDHGTPVLIYTGVMPPSSASEATLRDGMHTWREVQCLATSRDGLRSWQKAKEPIIAHPPDGLAITGFRDPYIWREGKEWLLVLGSGFPGKGGAILLYSSPDLRSWKYLHPLVEGRGTGQPSTNPVDNGEMWECPDFFPLGDKHVLIISTEGKVLWKTGTYQDRRFHPEKEGVVDHGAYYAAKTMLDHQGNRILWGWIPERRPEAEHRAAGWAGAMALPRVLSLSRDGNLQTEPAKASEVLRGTPIRVSAGPVKKVLEGLSTLRLRDLAAELQVEFTPKDEFTLELCSERDEPFVEIAYRPRESEKELRINRTAVPLSVKEPVSLRLLVDGSVVELFANRAVAITERVYSVPNAPLRIKVSGPSALSRLDLWSMKPISGDRLTS
jgi:beta-fructofuranosidase